MRKHRVKIRVCDRIDYRTRTSSHEDVVVRDQQDADGFMEQDLYVLYVGTWLPKPDWQLGNE